MIPHPREGGECVRIVTRLVVGLLLVIGVDAARAQTPPPSPPSSLPSIADKTKGLEKQDGFVPLYWNRADGTIWLEIPALDSELLYYTSLSAGLGSNDIGLDRGQLGGSHVVRFQRIGKKVLLVEPNYAFRATSDNPDERRAVTEAFATSVLWGFEAAAETDGRVLVDATAFVLRDVHDVVRSLKPASYGLDASRSAVNLARTKAFPRNTELDAILTFTGSGENAGRPAAACRAAASPTSRRRRPPSPCSSTTRSCGCRSQATSRCRSIPAPARSGRPGPISRRRCPSR